MTSETKLDFSLKPRPLSGRGGGGERKDGLVHTVYACADISRYLCIPLIFRKRFQYSYYDFLLANSRIDLMELNRENEDTFTSALLYAISKLCFCKQFRPKQVEAVRELYHHNDEFLWLSTGHCKSVALPFLFDVKHERTALPHSKHRVCLVISPLLSLMVDQVMKLKGLGIGSGITSSSSAVDKSLLASEAEIKLGSYKILFSALEAILEGTTWKNVVTEEPLQSQVVAIAVDEARSVYKWGTGFRPC